MSGLTQPPSDSMMTGGPTQTPTDTIYTTSVVTAPVDQTPGLTPDSQPIHDAETLPPEPSLAQPEPTYDSTPQPAEDLSQATELWARHRCPLQSPKHNSNDWRLQRPSRPRHSWPYKNKRPNS